MGFKERRKGDRRQSKNKGANDKFVLIGFGLLFALACYFALSGTFVAGSGGQQTTAAGARGAAGRHAAGDASGIDSNSSSSSSSSVASRRAEEAAFRKDVLRRDDELLAEYRQKKERRKEDSAHNNNGREFYERRVSQLEYQLENNKLLKDTTTKGSLGWGVKQSLDKLKSDPPPSF